MIMTIDNNNNKVTISFDLCMILLCECVPSKLHTRWNSSRSMVSPQLPWLPGFHECDFVSRTVTRLCYGYTFASEHRECYGYNHAYSHPVCDGKDFPWFRQSLDCEWRQRVFVFSGVVREYWGGHLYDGQVAGNDDDDDDDDDYDNNNNNNNNKTWLEEKINEKNSYLGRRVWPYWPLTYGPRALTCEYNWNLMLIYTFKIPTQCSRHNSRVHGKFAQ